MHHRELSLPINGINYHVDEYGEGHKSVILLHGMPDTAAVWRNQIPALVEAGFRVFAPDMLGYGRTDKPSAVARYAGEQVIADLFAMIETLELANPDIVGHDWGAFASWNMVALAPTSFRRHVALSVGHPASYLDDLSAEMFKSNWYMYVNAMPGADALLRAADFAYVRVWLETHPDVEEVIERLRQPGAVAGLLNWDAGNPMTLMYADAFESRGALPKCEVPTMGIWSKGDVYLWEAQVANSHRHMAAPWRYERLESGSHWAMLDNPEPVTRLIVEWLTAETV